MIHYWQHAGADVQDVQQDSQGCVTGAKVPRLNTGHGSVHSDATTVIACRQPKASRPPGVVCRSR
jgi:hypothetical protein